MMSSFEISVVRAAAQKRDQGIALIDLFCVSVGLRHKWQLHGWRQIKVACSMDARITIE